MKKVIVIIFSFLAIIVLSVIVLFYYTPSDFVHIPTYSYPYLASYSDPIVFQTEIYIEQNLGAFMSISVMNIHDYDILGTLQITTCMDYQNRDEVSSIPALITPSRNINAGELVNFASKISLSSLEQYVAGAEFFCTLSLIDENTSDIVASKDFVLTIAP